MQAAQFQRAVLAWHDRHGRRDLPWQRDITPYRVWVSEIMLQQTRVAAVRPYFERFVGEFPSVETLAATEEDRVLHLWTGLGYYARARNLLRTARIIAADYEGRFPQTVAELSRLPGIGRSTAGAIRSIAFERPAVILDGNVKRVLARYAAIEGWPGTASVSQALWALAERYAPERRCRDYSQAMMDLGSSVCSRSRPSCGRCPLSGACEARRLGRQEQFPGRKPRRPLPVKSTVMLLACAGQEVYLERRPQAGIWGGLWCFPEFPSQAEARAFCLDHLGATAGLEALPPLRHGFSHYQLDIQPVRCRLDSPPATIMAAGRQLWYNLREPEPIGLPRPVTRLLRYAGSSDS